MNNKKNADKWIKYVYEEWLDKKREPNFQPSVESLIGKLKRLSSDRRYFDDAWHCIQRVEELYNNVSHDTKESPRMLLECGIAAHKMGNSREAIRFLNGASSTYSEDHDRAIARWLLGCVYWCLEDSIRALATWENSLRDLNEATLKSGRATELERWYNDRKQEMKAAIKYSAENDEIPNAPERSSNKKKTSSKKHLLQTLPIIGQIPAGTPSDVLPPPMDYMNAEQVRINGKDYCIVSLLSGEKIVNIPPESRFYLLRVSGKSMNQCSAEPIENGDYVILREQNTAENGDIVAAIIVKDQGEDERRATLKRYKIQDEKIYLQPESDDPEFQKPVYANRVFDQLDDEFQIRGVAIAVLKPL